LKIELQDRIKNTVGAIDAPGLIVMLDELGVGDDIQFHERGLITIPAEKVKDFKSFQRDLKALSQIGQSFSSSMIEGCIQIDTMAISPSRLSMLRHTKSAGSPFSGALHRGKHNKFHKVGLQLQPNETGVTEPRP
jgi:hypothetical protein